MNALLKEVRRRSRRRAAVQEGDTATASAPSPGCSPSIPTIPWPASSRQARSVLRTGGGRAQAVGRSARGGAGRPTCRRSPKRGRRPGGRAALLREQYAVAAPKFLEAATASRAALRVAEAHGRGSPAHDRGGLRDSPPVRGRSRPSSDRGAHTHGGRHPGPLRPAFPRESRPPRSGGADWWRRRRRGRPQDRRGLRARDPGQGHRALPAGQAEPLGRRGEAPARHLQAVQVLQGEHRGQLDPHRRERGESAGLAPGHDRRKSLRPPTGADDGQGPVGWTIRRSASSRCRPALLYSRPTKGVSLSRDRVVQLHEHVEVDEQLAGGVELGADQLPRRGSGSRLDVRQGGHAVDGGEGRRLQPRRVDHAPPSVHGGGQAVEPPW